MKTTTKIKAVEKSFLRTDLPELHVGDSIKMKIKVAEADKVRLHPLEGTIICISGEGLRKMFTIRKISFGEGVERSFPIHSPLIDSIKIISSGRVKRSRLFYLRNRVGNEAKVKLG